MWSVISSGYKLLNIIENSVLNPEAYQKFLTDFQYIRTVQDKPDKHSENYEEQSLDLENHLMFHALYDERETFVSCAGVYRRPQWPQKTYRLLNRTYYNPQFRKPHTFQFFGSDYILPHQLKVCTTPMDFIFVSRQGAFALHSLQQVNQRQIFNNSFTLSEVFVQMVPNVFDSSSFQKILYSKLNPTAQIQFNCVKTLRDLKDSLIEKITF